MTKFLNISKDTTLGGSSASDEVVSSQKAIKGYIDGLSIPTTTSSVTKNSTSALTSGGAYTNLVRRKSTSSATGSSTQGVYVDANGQVQTCSAVTSTYTASGTAPVNGKAVSNAIATKQDNLVSGTNIKTINGNSLLGSGNIVVESSSTPDVDGTTISYNSSEALQTIAVKNKRDDSTLPIWQGTQVQWEQGVSKTWYYWQTSAVAGWSSGGSLPSAIRWYSIAYGNGRFVAIPETYKNTSYSTDGGVTWVTGGTQPQATGKIAYGDNRFVCIGGGSSKSVYSTDGGVTWVTGGDLPFISYPTSSCIGFGNGVFIAMKDGNIACSLNGAETWTSAGSLSFSNSSKGIAYGNGVFVYISSTNKGAYSTDNGVNWTEFQLSDTLTGCSITYANGRFVIAGKNGNQLRVFYSDDYGVSWTKVDTNISGMINDNMAISYGNNTLVVINYYVGSNSNLTAYSMDGGVTWQTATTPLSKPWDCIAFGDDKFVSIAYDSTDSCIFSVSYKKCYTETAVPTTSDDVYSSPDVLSGYTISSVTSGAITLSDNNTYYYNQSGNVNTYQSVGVAHPDWLCFINGVGVKIGTTTIATNNT